MLTYSGVRSRGFFAAAVLAGTAVVVSGCESKPAVATVASPTTATAAAPAAAASEPKAVTTTAPRPKLRPGSKTKVLDRAGDRPYDKTFDDIRFEMETGTKFRRSMLTKEIEALAGQKIRIRGYILPTPQQHGIKQFVLVRDNQECCFGPGAALYDCILVEMKPGNTANFTIRPIAVEGTFDVRPFTVDDKDLAIYHMEAETAQ